MLVFHTYSLTLHSHLSISYCERILAGCSQTILKLAVSNITSFLIQILIDLILILHMIMPPSHPLTINTSQGN